MTEPASVIITRVAFGLRRHTHLIGMIRGIGLVLGRLALRGQEQSPGDAFTAQPAAKVLQRQYTRQYP